MSNLATIPTDEMVDNYYAILLDAKTYERLGLEERAAGNRRIMGIIKRELERRGELDRINPERRR